MQKLILYLLFFISNFTSFGQNQKSELSDDFKIITLGIYNYNYNIVNHSKYFDTAKSLILSDNLDTLKKSASIFMGLNYYNKLKYSDTLLQPFYLQINKKCLSIQRKALIGIWKFDGSFVNECASQKVDYTDTGNLIKFDRDIVLFYSHDILKRTTSFDLTTELDINNYNETSFFKIHFSDINQDWLCEYVKGFTSFTAQKDLTCYSRCKLDSYIKKEK